MPDYPAFNVDYGLTLLSEPRNLPLASVAYHVAISRRPVFVDLQPGDGLAYRMILTPLKGTEDMAEVTSSHIVLSIPSLLWSRILDLQRTRPADFRTLGVSIKSHDVLAWWCECLWTLILEKYAAELDVLYPKALHGVTPRRGGNGG